MSIRGLIVVVTTMAMFVPVADAGAACNAIPDATTLVMMGANRTPEAQEVFDFVTVMTETQLASVRTTRSYKGALGRIDEIVPFAERGSRTLLVKVTLPRTNPRLFAGMFARVAMTIETPAHA